MSAGTLNSDEARDLKLPLKERFYLQPLTPTEAAARAKESAKEIVAAKKFIDQKAWPYLQNDLRLRAGYLRYDLNTIISAKPKDQKKSLKELTGKLFQDIDNVSIQYYIFKVKNCSCSTGCTAVLETADNHVFGLTIVNNPRFHAVSTFVVDGSRLGNPDFKLDILVL